MPFKLRNSMEGLIDSKNNGSECFICCHIRHLNSLKIHPQIITKAYKNIVNDLDFGKIEKRNNIGINVFCYESGLVYPVHISDEKFKNCMDLLLTTVGHKSHYVYIKDFNKFNCEKTFTVKEVKSTDRGDNDYNASYTEKYQRNIFLAVLLIKLLMINLANQLFFIKKKNVVNRFIKAILIEYEYFKKVMKKHYNKNVIMSEKDEQIFQSSNKCWICDKLVDVGDNKVRDHCHITGQCRGSAYWICNVNLKLTKNILVIFYNIKGYDSHLIMQEINKFDAKISVIPNGLEKCMAFTINNNLVFIDSMQFMKFCLNKLVKNLSDNDFKYLS